MDIRYDEKKLSEILESVYELLRTPISIFDGDFKYITSYPPSGYLTEYCSLIRESEERRALCYKSDETYCALCKREGRTVSYVCHAGVHETVMPIRFDERIVGYIMFGEYRSENDSPEISAYAERNGIDKQRLEEAYRGLTALSVRQVEATENILKSCVLEFWLSDAILFRETGLIEKIKHFIDENLAEPLRAEDICKKFFISRQRLYTLFGESYGVPVKSYILEKKMEKARRLLLTSEKSVAEIAAATGFGDYNNFIQRFKKMNGKTPLKYRLEGKNKIF